MSFAFRKEAAAVPLGTRKLQTLASRNLRSSTDPQRNLRPVPQKRHPQTTVDKPPILPMVDLGNAQRFADEGRLPDAAKICEEYLRTHPRSAEAYFLLGTIDAALGDQPSAEQRYRRVLYLNPEHEEALVYLALLTEAHGDMVAAARLRDRARRARVRAVNTEGSST